MNRRGLLNLLGIGGTAAVVAPTVVAKTPMFDGPAGEYDAEIMISAEQRAANLAILRRWCAQRRVWDKYAVHYGPPWGSENEW